MDKLMDKLPRDTALAIYRDALLMHLWQGRCEQVQRWAGPVFYMWAKVVCYGCRWPGSTETDSALAWDDGA